MYPQDSEGRKIGSKACQILHYTLDTNDWEYKQELGEDVGRDCILELSEDNLWKNHKVEGQIKGSRSPQKILNGTCVSFPMGIKTINYALGSPVAFVLFLVDTDKELVYFQPIQEYFIANPELLDKLSDNQKTLNIRIPCENILQYKADDLQELAKVVYKRKEDGHIIRV